MKKILLTMVLLITGCAAGHLPSEAVIKPNNLASEQCVDFQTQHYDDLVALTNQIPFPMKINSLGCVQYKGKKFLGIELVGNTYNTIQTTTISRLSNEFFKKFRKTTSIMMNPLYIGNLSGIHIIMHCSSYNFVTDEYALNRQAENLEIFVSKENVKLFIDANITAQELLNRSTVLINAQRMKFELKLL